jgi:hypothetical protein
MTRDWLFHLSRYSLVLFLIKLVILITSTIDFLMFWYMHTFHFDKLQKLREEQEKLIEEWSQHGS